MKLSILVLYQIPAKCNGEGGIRTRGTDKPYTAFPRLLLKPLGHLSKNVPKMLSARFFIG